MLNLYNLLPTSRALKRLAKCPLRKELIRAFLNKKDNTNDDDIIIGDDDKDNNYLPSQEYLSCTNTSIHNEQIVNDVAVAGQVHDDCHDRNQLKINRSSQIGSQGLLLDCSFTIIMNAFLKVETNY